MLPISSCLGQAQGVYPTASGAATEMSLGNPPSLLSLCLWHSSGSLCGLNSERAAVLKGGRGITRKNIGLGRGTRGEA